MGLSFALGVPYQVPTLYFLPLYAMAAMFSPAATFVEGSQESPNPFISHTTPRISVKRSGDESP